MSWATFHIFPSFRFNRSKILRAALNNVLIVLLKWEGSTARHSSNLISLMNVPKALKIFRQYFAKELRIRGCNDGFFGKIGVGQTRKRTISSDGDNV